MAESETEAKLVVLCGHSLKRVEFVKEAIRHSCRNQNYILSLLSLPNQEVIKFISNCSLLDLDFIFCASLHTLRVAIQRFSCGLVWSGQNKLQLPSCEAMLSFFCNWNFVIYHKLLKSYPRKE